MDWSLTNVVEFLSGEQDLDALNECEGNKIHPCGLCTKVCMSECRLTCHSNAKHPGEAVSEKNTWPIDLNSVQEMVLDAIESLAASDIYGSFVQNY